MLLLKMDMIRIVEITLPAVQSGPGVKQLMYRLTITQTGDALPGATTVMKGGWVMH